jgi:hypothetical protein
VKSIVLLPYCPWPADTGAKVDMWKYLEVLKEMGECKIISAARKPVGAGWTDEHRKEIERRGFSVVLREDELKTLSFSQIAGLTYASFCQALGMDRAFGHSNPYHRYAFPAEWWKRHTEGADIAVLNYSYFAWLPCACPKVVVLHDLWSDYMWEGPELETRELMTADLVIALSSDEMTRLKQRGIKRMHWSPPSVEQAEFSDSANVALVGSASKFNYEGLKWLESAVIPDGLKIRVYGGLSTAVRHPAFLRMGKYDDSKQPYQDCGIIAVTTVQGMGVQIKTVEALAYGRAIVARKGAMRGFPKSAEPAWVEVDDPQEMVKCIAQLRNDRIESERWAAKARDYYNQFLDSRKIKQDLSAACWSVISDREKISIDRG